MESTTIVETGRGPGAGSLKRVSWGAVFAGVVIAFVAMLTLSLLGMAIGLSTIDPREEQNPFAGLGTGAAVWWSFSMLASLFAGGWVAGRLAGVPRKFEAGLHGAVTWGLVTLLTVYFVATSVGRVIGGATRLVAQGVSSVAQGVAAATPEIGSGFSGSTGAKASDGRSASEVLQTIKSEGAELLRQTGNPELKPENLQAEAERARQTVASTAESILSDPSDAGRELDRMIDKLFAQGKEIANSADRDDLGNVIAARTGKSKAEANAIVDRWIASYNEAKEEVKDEAAALAAQAERKTREVGESTADGLSKAAFWAFAGVALSGVAGICGGCVGRPKRIVPIPDELEDGPGRRAV
jgi:hypothetical protein